ncbi:hypothetical protein QJQ45_016890, partial [Haematococcus lacustris]
SAWSYCRFTADYAYTAAKSVRAVLTASRRGPQLLCHARPRKLIYLRACYWAASRPVVVAAAMLSSTVGPGDKAASPPLDEKEMLRRQRISKANAGKDSWNQGRKWTPEQRAKIAAATKAAMQRPEVRAKYEAAVAEKMKSRTPMPEEERAKRSVAGKAARERIKAEMEALGLVPKPGSGGSTEPRPPRSPRKKAVPVPADGAAADPANPGDPAAGVSVKKPRAPRKPRVKAEAAQGEGEAGEEASVKEPKPRTPVNHSEERRKKISEAIRAKWQDPEYRARTVAAINQRAIERYGDPGDKPRRVRRRTQVTEDGEVVPARRSGVSQQTKNEKEMAAVKEHLQYAQAVVDKVTATKRLIAKMDMNLEVTRAKMEAFMNDSRMAARSQQVVRESEAVLAHARSKLRELEQQVPRGINYNSQGQILISDPEQMRLGMAARARATAARRKAMLDALPLALPSAGASSHPPVPGAGAGRGGGGAGAPGQEPGREQQPDLWVSSPPAGPAPGHTAAPRSAPNPDSLSGTGSPFPPPRSPPYANGVPYANGTHSQGVGRDAAPPGPQLRDEMSATRLILGTSQSPPNSHNTPPRQQPPHPPSRPPTPWGDTPAVTAAAAAAATRQVVTASQLLSHMQRQQQLDSHRAGPTDGNGVGGPSTAVPAQLAQGVKPRAVDQPRLSRVAGARPPGSETTKPAAKAQPASELPDSGAQDFIASTRTRSARSQGRNRAR